MHVTFHDKEIIPPVFIQLERFWMQANLVISLLGGCGLWTLYSLLVKRYPNLERNIYMILSIGSVLFGARQAVSLIS